MKWALPTGKASRERPPSGPELDMAGAGSARGVP